MGGYAGPSQDHQSGREMKSANKKNMGIWRMVQEGECFRKGRQDLTS